MKIKLFTLFISLVLIYNVNAQCTGNVYIPNVAFKVYLLENESINTVDDGQISCEEANAFSGTINVDNLGITNLTGIEAFVNLKYLNCEFNALTSLNISNNTALELLRCNGNSLTSLDVSNNTALTELRCGSNLLTSLDVSNNTVLERLRFDFNDLTSIDVSNNTALKSLNFIANLLTDIDVSNNLALDTLLCNSNLLTAIDVSNNIALEGLYCDSNLLTSLDVSNNTALQVLNCSYNSLISLDVSNNGVLQILNCHNNQLTSLKLTNGNSLLLNTMFSSFENNPSLRCIEVDDLAFAETNWETIKDETATYSEACVYCTVKISDNIFKDYLLNNENINTLDDGRISCEEASNFKGTIDVSNLGINNLAGIEAFVNLTGLFCASNSLTSLDVSANIALESLDCSANDLMGLDISNNSSLTELNCSYNELIFLKLTNGNNVLFNVANSSFRNNRNLTCIAVDDIDYSNTNWSTIKDNVASYSVACITLSSTDDSRFERVKIYPNPVLNTLHVDVRSELTIKTVSIYNVLGKKLMDSKGPVIDVRHLLKGMYVLKISDEFGNVAIHKIMKE